MSKTHKSSRTVSQAILGTVLGMVIAAATKAVWRRVWGDMPDPNDPDTPAARTLTWAAISGLSTGLASVLAARFIARRHAAVESGLPAEEADRLAEEPAQPAQSMQ